MEIAKKGDEYPITYYGKDNPLTIRVPGEAVGAGGNLGMAIIQFQAYT